MQWTECESNLQPFSYESDTLAYHYTTAPTEQTTLTAMVSFQHSNSEVPLAISEFIFITGPSNNHPTTVLVCAGRCVAGHSLSLGRKSAVSSDQLFSQQDHSESAKPAATAKAAAESPYAHKLLIKNSLLIMLFSLYCTAELVFVFLSVQCYAMHEQNINLPVYMCLSDSVCVCVRHTFCQLAYRSDPSTDFYS